MTIDSAHLGDGGEDSHFNFTQIRSSSPPSLEEDNEFTYLVKDPKAKLSTNFLFVATIGTGQFGQVFLIQSKKDKSRTYAVKRVPY
mmetsp:Transcript_1823/g.2446  ORF Transcript_1823/g.2446 Transcript_1823/m.2446 type:complete len:86 (-) Transcript_1823:1002-1259(-)|eukprot:CAMPEP_0170499800 /NCGR_PEP_ID=MMETSP0208-20121228/32615_1 /TAXON_ID=197538 /ORGANISM="Strombidium inclinatum, Strain S3" /LENGTH=85 /DNA_ID=CAMNT_0010777529 /DNA_START=1131 /DNA_END=1388 /DNA_ORIENTATION=+